MTVAIGTKVAKMRETNDSAMRSDAIIIKDLVESYLNEGRDRRESLGPMIADRANHLARLVSRDEGFRIVEDVA